MMQYLISLGATPCFFPNFLFHLMSLTLIPVAVPDKLGGNNRGHRRYGRTGQTSGCWVQVVPVIHVCRVAEVAREHGWHPPKSLDSDENFKPEHTLFCRELRFVAIYALFFFRSWGKKSAFLGKNSAFWARSALLYGIYCIFY